MTDQLITALLSVNPDATIKDLVEFACFVSEEDADFSFKELDIKKKALQVIRKLSMVQIK